VLVEPSKNKKVKVVLDFPTQENIPKSEAKFIEKFGIKKYKFINAGNQHLIHRNKKEFFLSILICSVRV